MMVFIYFFPTLSWESKSLAFWEISLFALLDKCEGCIKPDLFILHVGLYADYLLKERGVKVIVVGFSTFEPAWLFPWCRSAS